jgi:hypothetical protein
MPHEKSENLKEIINWSVLGPLFSTCGALTGKRGKAKRIAE